MGRSGRGGRGFGRGGRGKGGQNKKNGDPNSKKKDATDKKYIFTLIESTVVVRVSAYETTLKKKKLRIIQKMLLTVLWKKSEGS